MKPNRNHFGKKLLGACLLATVIFCVQIITIAFDVEPLSNSIAATPSAAKSSAAKSSAAKSSVDAGNLDDAEKLFKDRVLPILKSKCFSCHGEDSSDLKGDLDLTTREGMLAGGESEEAAIVPGVPGESPLVRSIKRDDLEMPPESDDQLTDDEIDDIVTWIEEGAPWPDA